MILKLCLTKEIFKQMENIEKTICDSKQDQAFKSVLAQATSLQSLPLQFLRIFFRTYRNGY